MDAEELSDRLLKFTVRVGKIVDALPDTKQGRHVQNQLLRSGTSPAPNYDEARVAESRKDFIHKLCVCNKELYESRSWLRYIIEAQLLPEHRVQDLLEECNELCRTFTNSILTAKNNSRTP